MRNLSLVQQYPGNDSLVKKEQKKIETQLKDFRDKLWAVNDANTEASAKAKAPKEAKKEEKKSATQEKNTETKARSNEVKQSSSSSSSSSSAPVRSMRGRSRK
jgi:hypothetical protein